MSHAPTDSSPILDNDAIVKLLNNYNTIQARLQQLEAAVGNPDGKVVEAPKTTTLKLYPKLLEKYPAIGEPDFYTAVLAKDHDFCDISDYHVTGGMAYKAPSVLGHAEVSIGTDAKLHDADLATVQSRIAHNTRFFDTFAHEIIESDQCETEFGQRTLRFLNTLRLTVGNDAGIISHMRSKLYYSALGIKHEPAKERPILKVVQVAASKTASDLIRTVCKKPEQATNIKTTQHSSGGKSNWKSKSSGTNDKTKDQQHFKKKTQGSKDNKSGGSKSYGKSSSKPNGSSYSKKRSEQGNYEEESD
ncbi:hypothetical protein BGX27_002957 [Mortierella sp. AM989]|nr:hypothetical protein BGX27_002957 [Mortierella sp. AM989]